MSTYRVRYSLARFVMLVSSVKPHIPTEMWDEYNRTSYRGQGHGRQPIVVPSATINWITYGNGIPMSTSLYPLDLHYIILGKNSILWSTIILYISVQIKSVFVYMLICIIMYLIFTIYAYVERKRLNVYGKQMLTIHFVLTSKQDFL